MTETYEGLHLIGDVARRTGLSVSAIRYYSDEGLVEPTDETDGGHRLYDAEAIARLEFIRTLRDLETGLDQVRRVLTGTVELRDLLAEHLEFVETRTRDLQAKRAVLRALVRSASTQERARLLRRLVTMSDAQRQSLVDDFLAEVSRGMPADVADRLREARPQLTDDPAPAQLDAWIDLAELLQDDDYRAVTREYLRETYASEIGRRMAEPGIQDSIRSAGEDLMPRLAAAHSSGLSPEDPYATDLAGRFVQQTATAGGAIVDDELRNRLASRYREIDELLTRTLQHDDYRASEGRYLDLVAIINGTPGPEESVRGDVDLAGFGEWLSRAILAAR
ncbi:DNA-binding transcriptional MerR regulator [Microbacterium sp. W4I4]|uniref:helix-turn-helix domain-containing protein n=1 Tax=Microbacterium sp. W4I4 TaxID=3042295 RepID=UPI0027841014|nr:MerR family transcriptional regulator [Microbacterium sp. W4I4]MDQ0615113.1 DNA-binding transcriptional MerR regulator [Microbacterium sp. W4I4]